MPSVLDARSTMRPQLRCSMPGQGRGDQGTLSRPIQSTRRQSSNVISSRRAAARCRRKRSGYRSGRISSAPHGHRRDRPRRGDVALAGERLAPPARSSSPSSVLGATSAMATCTPSSASRWRAPPDALRSAGDDGDFVLVALAMRRPVLLHGTPFIPGPDSDP